MAEVGLEERSCWSHEFSVVGDNWSSVPHALCWWNVDSNRSCSWVILDLFWHARSSVLGISTFDDSSNIGISVLWSTEVGVLWNLFNHSGESAGGWWASSGVTHAEAWRPHDSGLWSINIDWMAEWLREELLWSVLLIVIPRACWDSVATLFFLASESVAWVRNSWRSSSKSVRL